MTPCDEAFEKWKQDWNKEYGKPADWDRNEQIGAELGFAAGWQAGVEWARGSTDESIQQATLLWRSGSNRAVALDADGEMILIRLAADGCTQQGDSK